MKDGCAPATNLAFDPKGNLYGTTVLGGQGDCSGRTCGTVFELISPISGGKWKETVLHRFAGGSDGGIPIAGVVLDAAGNIYGTTESGGETSCGCGTVFELTPQIGGGWNEKILHSFSGTDGADPYGVIFDRSGNLYGVTAAGGVNQAGVAFQLAATGDVWNESVIYNFGSDGTTPVNGLTLRKGNLYGATAIGGADNSGTIFELKKESNGGWAHSVLYSFTGGKDGHYPWGLLVFDRSGNLYGSTSGDVTCTKGYRWACGNVFELMPQTGGHWEVDVLHTFPGGTACGRVPQ